MSPAARDRIVLAAVLAAAGLLFASSLQFPFVWDDTAVIRDNPFIHSPVGAGIFFSPRYWKNLIPVSRFDYRPLQMLTLAAISRVGGQDPLYYRTVNLALHLLATLLLFILAGRLGAGRTASLLAAAFFAFHPVHVETVVGARNLSELMTSVLLCSALIVFPCGPGRGSLIAAGLLFGAALLYKESALILPLLLVILVPAKPGGIRNGRAARLKTIPFWLLAAGAGIAKTLLSSGSAVSSSLPATHFLAGAARLQVINLRLLFFPAPLRVLYHFPPLTSLAEPVWFFSLAGVVLLAGILLATRKDRLLFALLLGLAGSLLPSLYRLGSPGRIVAEQRLYLPSFFFCLAAAVLIERAGAGGGARRRTAIRLSGWLICLPLIGLTGDYLSDWRDEIPLWNRVTVLSPRAGIAFNNLGIALSRAGDSGGAERNWERALKIAPGLPEAHTNLGILRGREGRWEDAADHFRAALEADRSHHPAALYLAQTYRQMGRDEEAADLLRGILEENPDHAAAANELAIVLERMGQTEEAEELYREAASLNPQYAAPLRNLAALYGERGEFERALAAGREAVEKRPDQPRGYVTLSGIYIKLGRLEEARKVLSDGARRHPDDWRIKSRLLALDSAAPE